MPEQESFRLLPEQASTLAEEVDAVFKFLVAVGGFFIVIIFIFIVYFALKYHQSRNVNRKIEASKSSMLAVEVIWSIVPLILVMIMFGWGAAIYFNQHTPPGDALEIHVVGKQWMWKLQHPDGQREINELHIPIGQPVRLQMISEDVIHSFYVPAFRMKMDVLPGRYTSTWFQATQEGEYHLFCAEYCGTDHSKMRGRIVVMSPGAYAQWLQQQQPAVSRVARGKELFEQFRCANCHLGTAPIAPSLAGVAGSQVQLAEGAMVVADRNYLRESILDPSAKVVAGFQPRMPSFRGQLGEEALFDLIEYLYSLRPEENSEEKRVP